MTVCPQRPRLDPTCDRGVMEVSDTHVTYVALPFGMSLVVTIRAGYMTDGATIPPELQDAFGWSPWDMPRLLAAIVHDALYSLHWCCRWACDLVYRKVLVQVGHPVELAAAEYSAVRLAGRKSWEGVGKEERRLAKSLVFVQIRRTPR